MAKRRADDLLITSSPKRCRGPCGADMLLKSMAPSDPPSLLALLGSRCRKRHFYFDETDDTDSDFALFRKGTNGDSDFLKHTAHLKATQQQQQQQQHTSGNSLEHTISASIATSTNKRPREDSEAPAETTKAKAKVKVDTETTDDNDKDSSFNTFQFWRTPLPELDMSLLQMPLQKDTDAMET